MGALGFIANMFLLFFNFLGMVLLERRLAGFYAKKEVGIMVFLGLLSLVLLILVLQNKKWAWPFGIVLYSFVLGNSAFLLFAQGISILLFLTLFVNVFSFVIVVLVSELDSYATNIEGKEPVLEVYDTNEKDKDYTVESVEFAKPKKKGKKKK